MRKACMRRGEDGWLEEAQSVCTPGGGGLDVDGGGVQGMCREDEADILTVGLEPTISALGGQRLIH